MTTNQVKRYFIDRFRIFEEKHFQVANGLGGLLGEDKNGNILYQDKVCQKELEELLGACPCNIPLKITKEYRKNWRLKVYGQNISKFLAQYDWFSSKE